MVGAMFDLESLAALLAQTLHRLLPFYVCEKLCRRSSRGEDEMFVFGALLDKIADFVLVKG